jgi:signal transduction histidine kinase
MDDRPVSDEQVNKIPTSLLPQAADGLLKLLGLITWLAYAPLAWFNAFLGQPRAGLQSLETPALIIWLIAYLAFGVILFRLTLCQDTREGFYFRVYLTLLTTIAVLVMSWLLPWSGGFGGLLIIPAALAARLFSPKTTFLWLTLQNAAFAGILAWQGASPLSLLCIAFISLQLFAVLTSRMALDEAKGREEIARINQELLSSRTLLAETSRQKERLRIAQDLHDLMGHQLTTLHLNLETLARCQQGPRAKQVLQRSHHILTALFDDVRSAVSALRDDEPKDFEQAVHHLLSPLPGVQIHLNVQGPLRLENPEITKTGLCCLQEILTNTLRHAQAQNLWILLESSAEALLIQSRDDGQGTQQLRVGHGLTGMRERVEALGGQIQISSQKGEGFMVHVQLPRVAQPKTHSEFR